MIIGIDFDGTVVTHKYPNIGEDVGAVPVLKGLLNKGHRLILYTMRSGKELDEAVDWFKDKDIELYGVNENPEQHVWTSSPKPYCNMYIDDSAFGCPLKSTKEGGFFVDWEVISDVFKEHNLI